MSHLKRITDAHAELLAGKLAMQVSIPYSLAAELATKADAFDAGGHASVPMHVLDQLLTDPENQPSQFGTVPVEALERCERMLAETTGRTLPEGWAVDDHYSHYVLTSPSGDEAVVYKVVAPDDSSNDEFLRQLAQQLTQGKPNG